MPDGDDRLDELVRRALSSGDAAGGPRSTRMGEPAQRSVARQRVIAGIRRRRARRLQALAGLAALAVAAGIGVPQLLSGGGTPPATEAAGRASGTTAHAPVGRHQAARAPRPTNAAFLPRTAGSARCSGATRPGATCGSFVTEGSARSATSADDAATGAPQAAAAPLVLDKGASATVSLPSPPTGQARWGRPVTRASSPADGAGPVVALRLLGGKGAASGSARGERFALEGLHAGTATVAVVAGARTSGSGTPAGASLEWVLRVRVR